MDSSGFHWLSWIQLLFYSGSNVTHEPEVVADVDERMPQVKFSDATTEVINVVPYSEIYGIHPSKFVFGKNCNRILLDKLDDANTGLSAKDARAGNKKFSLRSGRRGAILHRTLVDGAAWEPSTADIIVKISKKTFKPKRDAAKAAKDWRFSPRARC